MATKRNPNWIPTHTVKLISFDGNGNKDIAVEFCPRSPGKGGPLRSYLEWANFATSDYSLSDSGELLFQGRPECPVNWSSFKVCRN